MSTQTHTRDHAAGYSTDEIMHSYDREVRSARIRRWLLGIGALVGVAIAAVAVLLVTTTSSTPSAPAAPTTSTSNPAVPGNVPSANPAVPSRPNAPTVNP
ncbi:MAG: hypothetical protein WAK82_43105, partial [Streptosporangiaceae bacterium]